MKVGDVVVIYEDPLTQKKPEGKATLIKLVMDDVEMQRWEVESLGERYFRWIKKALNP